MAPKKTTVEDIALDRIYEAPGNPRSESWGDIEGLAQSMRDRGQDTPATVRRGADDGYELIDGARRLRAAHLAELGTLACIVRDVTAAEAHMMRLTSFAREDITPLEEAHAYGIAIEQHGFTAEVLASQTGRTIAYVTQRLRLLELAPEAAKLLEAKRIGVESALLLAQLPAAQQREIGLRLASSTGPSHISRSDVARWCDNAVRELDAAPFPTDDETLVPDAGPCSTCPNRTGRQGALFGVMESDSCLLVSCFVSKADAQWVRESDAARSEGIAVIEGDAARKALGYNAPFVSLKATACERDASGTLVARYHANGVEEVSWNEVLGEPTPHALSRDPGNLEIHELYPADVAHQALRSKLGLSTAESRGSSSTKSGTQRELGDEGDDDEGYRADLEAEQKRREREKEKAAIEADAQERAMAALVGAVEERASDDGLLRALVLAICQGTWAEVIGKVIKRRGWSDVGADEKKLPPIEVIVRELADMTTAQASALAVEIVATRTSVWTGGPSGFDLLCAAKNVDLAHHRREAAAALKEKKREKREREKAKAKASKSKARKSRDEESESAEDDEAEAAEE